MSSTNKSLLDFFDEFKAIDADTLAAIAQRAVEIIIPLCEMEHPLGSRVIGQEIRQQFQTYAQAVDFSVQAAMEGYNITKDVLTVLSAIHETSADERREFLEGTLEMTNKCYEGAREAHRRFLRGRAAVDVLLQDMKNDAHTNNHIRSPMKLFLSFKTRHELDYSVQDLEQFARILDNFAKWWMNMSTETQTQIQRTRFGAKSLGNADRKTLISSIVKKWEAHGDRYFKYATKMNVVQDHYPNIFKLPSTKQEKIASERSESPPLTYLDSKNTPASFAKENPTTSTQHLSEDRRMLACTPDKKGAPYISATLAMVKKLPDDHCFLQFDIQHHQSDRSRVSHMDLNFSFRAASSPSSLAIRGLAPKESIGARNADEEAHGRKVGLGIPVKAYGAGAEFNAEYQVAKVVEHATVIRGSIGGENENCAKWTVDEDASAMTGVPSHFCLALVLEYSDVFTLNLEIEAHQFERRLKGLYWQDGPEIRITGSKEMNIASLEENYKVGWPASWVPAAWKDWLPEITGDANGGNVFHSQIPVRPFWLAEPLFDGTNIPALPNTSVQQDYNNTDEVKTTDQTPAQETIKSESHTNLPDPIEQKKEDTLNEAEETAHDDLKHSHLPAAPDMGSLSDDTGAQGPSEVEVAPDPLTPAISEPGQETDMHDGQIAEEETTQDENAGDLPPPPAVLITRDDSSSESDPGLELSIKASDCTRKFFPGR